MKFPESVPAKNFPDYDALNDVTAKLKNLDEEHKDVLKQLKEMC